MKIGRREFIKLCGLIGAKVLLLPSSSCTLRKNKPSKAESAGLMPKHTLGKTGRKVSIIGVGGMAMAKLDQQYVNRFMAKSIELGINYFDVAPTYGDSEIKYGKALKPYCKDIFLACKTTERTAAGAKKELDRSLERLQTDHLDLYQFHAINNLEKDVDVIFGKGGALETFLDARRNGIIRSIGFSSHSDKAALEAMRRFDFDTIMFPVNFAAQYKANFVADVAAEAKKRGVGLIAIKSLAYQRWPKDADTSKYPTCWYQPIDTPELAKLALAWSYAQGADAILPPGDAGLVRLAMGLAPQALRTDPKEFTKLREIADTIEHPIFPT
ncbi:MAG: aldo/keto reductase [Planctomycetota bacterium]